MKRKQFTFYRSYLESIEKLPTNKEKLQAYQLICGYSLNREVPDIDNLKISVQALFAMIKPTLDIANTRAELAKNLRKKDSPKEDPYTAS